MAETMLVDCLWFPPTDLKHSLNTIDEWGGPDCTREVVYPGIKSGIVDGRLSGPGVRCFILHF
jgi:hypothetical protein